MLGRAVMSRCPWLRDQRAGRSDEPCPRSAAGFRILRQARLSDAFDARVELRGHDKAFDVCVHGRDACRPGSDCARRAADMDSASGHAPRGARGRRCDRGGIHDRSPSDVLRISGPRRDVAQSREVLQEYNGTRPKRRNGGPPPRLAFVASVAARTGKPAAVSASAVALRVRSALGLSGAGATVIMSSRSAAYGGMRGQLGVSAIRE